MDETGNAFNMLHNNQLTFKLIMLISILFLEIVILDAKIKL
jgi:hypothetical protein